MPIVFALLLTGCAGSPSFTLMPTPILYLNSAVDPFAHLSNSQKQPSNSVYYLTNRSTNKHPSKSFYGNKIDERLHFGRADVQIGPSDIDWNELAVDSIAMDRKTNLELTVRDVQEMGTISAGTQQEMTYEMQQFIDSINADLAKARDKEIMVYIHGTKTDFASAAMLTAEIGHFAGRDFVGIAFAWPSHQNILSYLIGVDVKRARNSSPALEKLITILAEHTTAKRINLLSYSAGGRVTSKTLYELRKKNWIYQESSYNRNTD